MYRTYRHLISFYLVFLSLFISQQIFADEMVNDEVLQKILIKAKPINEGGFIFDIQQVDPALLAEDVEKLRGFYIRHQHELAQKVDDKKLNAGDAIITVIMPGGLLYAGYRKQEHEKAKQALLVVTTELGELSDDLIALQGQDKSHPLLLAQLP